MTHTQKTHPLLYVAASALLLASSFVTADASEAFLAAQSATVKTPRSTLVLEVSGLETPQGQLMAALFDSEESYKNDTPLQGAADAVTGDIVRIKFSKLRIGHHAFKLFYDANGNGELDRDVLGVPIETYYFSNNASDPFSAPEWGEAKFLIANGRTTKTIDLNKT